MSTNSNLDALSSLRLAISRVVSFKVDAQHADFPLVDLQWSWRAPPLPSSTTPATNHSLFPLGFTKVESSGACHSLFIKRNIFPFSLSRETRASVISLVGVIMPKV